MSDRIIVVVSLRGGVDALNAVVPHGDADYYRLRPTLSIPPPGRARLATIDLDGFYGFHPALAPLVPLYGKRELAIVHAVGWPGVSHSHFEAWEEIECGGIGEDRPSSGWLARALTLAENGIGSALRAVAAAETMPRLLNGTLGAAVLRSLEDFRLQAPSGGRHRLEHALQVLYRGSLFPVGASGRRTLEALKAIEKVSGEHPPASTGSPFERQLGMIERLIQADVGLEAASVELGGWDFHFAEGAASGAMAGLLGELAHGLAGFAHRLGEDWKRVTVVAISEFGRRAAENGSGGTDHGQGGIMFIAGGSVRGGRIICDWPGLSPLRLAGPGDLALTCDFRDVLLEILPRGLSEADRERVFPRYQKRRQLGLLAAG